VLVRFDARLIAAIAAALFAGPPALGQVLHGTVWDTTSEQPVAGSHVIVFSATGTKMGDTVTNATGRFTFHLAAAGDYTLVASALGYATVTGAIAVNSTYEASALLETAPNPVVLKTITVRADKQDSHLSEVGFYRRQRMGFGYFLTRAEIERRSPLVMSDLLLGIPGVRVHCRGVLSCTVEMRAARTMFFRGGCQPSVVLDGLVLRVGGVGSRGDLTVNELLSPFNIEAVEVYPGPAGLPVQYQGYVSPCGAIIAWSSR
jgi:Carboxypeptidase regulatory-like domain/TonB-dependent Receptor Plug Domain